MVSRTVQQASNRALGLAPPRKAGRSRASSACGSDATGFYYAASRTQQRGAQQRGAPAERCQGNTEPARVERGSRGRDRPLARIAGCKKPAVQCVQYSYELGARSTLIRFGSHQCSTMVRSCGGHPHGNAVSENPGRTSRAVDDRSEDGAAVKKLVILEALEISGRTGGSGDRLGSLPRSGCGMIDHDEVKRELGLD